MFGFVVGVLGGYYKRLEWVLSASTDAILSIPSLPLLILIGIIFVVTNQLIIGGLMLVLWPPAARAVRSQVASIKKLPYVDAARTSGYSDWRIIWQVIVPKVGSIAMAYFVLLVSVSIVLVTALEFIGVGNPQIVSWGSILYFAQQYGFFSGRLVVGARAGSCDHGRRNRVCTDRVFLRRNSEPETEDVI